MKNKIPYILIAGLVVMQVYSINKINDLQTQIADNSYTLNDRINAISTQVNYIYSDVDNRLEEQASIIHNSSFAFGEIDIDTLLVPVTFTVEPKQVTDTMTVSLKFDDETILLSKADTVYSGTKMMELTDDETFPAIVIEDDGTQSITQDGGLRIYNLVNEFIPRLNVLTMRSYSISTSPTSDLIEYYNSSELFIDGNYENFKTGQYVTYVDNEKVNEIDIDLSECSEGEPILPSAEGVTLEKGQILTTYFVVLDAQGFTHQYPIEHYYAGSEIQREPYYGVVRITDKNGEIIYDSIESWEYSDEYKYETEA